MAQPATARAASTADGRGLTRLTEREIHEIDQYEKIVRFRDTVLSGKHATIRLPPGLKALADSLPPQPKTSPLISVNSAVSEALPSGPDKAAKPHKAAEPLVVEAGPSAAPVAPRAPPSAQRPLPLSSARTEINPILLEKSDELIRAEFHLQRQRLERALKDELEERRLSKKAASLVVLDLSDVLTRALKLVEATDTTPLPADEDLTANHEAASDSFDNDTFYSSQHDTPESKLTSRIRNPSEAARVPGASPTQRRSPVRAPVSTRIDSESPVREALDATLLQRPAAALPQHGLPAEITNGRSGAIAVPGLNNYADGPGGGLSAGQGPVNGGQSGRTGGREQPNLGYGPPQHPAVDAIPGLRPPSPLVRGDAPVVPAASYSSQLLTQASPMEIDSEAMTVPSGAGSAAGTSVQIASLRGDITVIASDTSSGERNGEKKKPKKKRRRIDQPAPEAELHTYIKPEPRSASPLTAPAYIRPNKRQRHSQIQPAEPTGSADPADPAGPTGPIPPAGPAPRAGHISPAGPDATDPGYLRLPADSLYELHPPYRHRQERIPIVYDEPMVYPRRVMNTATVIREPPRWGREDADEYEMPGGAYLRRAPSPQGPPYPHSPREAHSARAVPQYFVNDSFREPPRAYRDSYEQSRMSVRPEGDAFMVPQNAPPTRMVVDAYGHVEYIEPPRPAPRHSVAPPARPGESEIVYEISSRPMSGHPGAGAYDEGRILYPRPPPSYAVARRYITQPEYISHEYRDTRHREYSAQPAGHGEYVRFMSPHDRRRMEDRPRECISRAANVRPPDDVRYGAPHGYGRMHSVRPEIPQAREPAGSGHPESRYGEGAPGYPGEHGSGPAQQQQQQQQFLRREYSVRPAEQYNEAVVHGDRRGDEMAFVEGPRRRTQEVLYVDDVRRELYRP